MEKLSVTFTQGRKKLLNPAARFNGRVFDTDPVVTYMLLEMSQEERLAYLPIYWSTLVKSALLNDAVITEANDWEAASVIIPPGKCVDNVWTLIYAGFLCVLWKLGFSGFKRLWTEFSGMTDNAKKKGLHGQKRDICTSIQIVDMITGLAKAIMREHQHTAQSENVPIWLEATSPGSRNMYLSLGFKEIEEIIVGKGKVAADATRQPGGPGIPIYAMVWWPELSSSPER
ncbi:Acyl-CoA N-acyltransferase [Penicillium verhagenii]|nr:Acyl-CoA N-acyltransferase [Penicillium verhagenii]